MIGIAELGNACSEVGVEPKQMDEFCTSKNRSRRTLKNEIPGSGRKHVGWQNMRTEVK